MFDVTNAVKSGLLTELGPERWHTLCVLAAFRDNPPTQDELARLMGVRRETANRRIKALCEFLVNGEPILTKTQPRNKATQRFQTVHYTINWPAGVSVD
jgi:hypothetical protein